MVSKRILNNIIAVFLMFLYATYSLGMEHKTEPLDLEANYQTALSLLVNLKDFTAVNHALYKLEVGHSQGHTESSYSLALLLHRNKDPEIQQRGLQIMQSLAVNNHSEAQHKIGSWYLWGNNCKPNMDLAKKYLSLASQNGHADQVNADGVFLSSNTNSSSTNLQKIIVLFESAGSANHKMALMNLGYLYRQLKNDKKSLEAFSHAAQLRDPSAFREIAHHHFKQKNFIAAYENYTLASAYGLPLCNTLIDCWFTKTSDKQTKKSVAQAFLQHIFTPSHELHFKSIESGLPSVKPTKAQTEITTLINWYSVGVPGIEKNFDKAFRFIHNLKPNKQIKEFSNLTTHFTKIEQLRKTHEAIIYHPQGDNNKQLVQDSYKWLVESYLNDEIEEHNPDILYSWLTNYCKSSFLLHQKTAQSLLELAFNVLKKEKNPTKQLNKRATKLLSLAIKFNATFTPEMVIQLTSQNNRKYFEHIVDTFIPMSALEPLANYYLKQSTAPSQEVIAMNMGNVNVNFNLCSLSEAMVTIARNPMLTDQWAQGKFKAFLVYAAACGNIDDQIELAVHVTDQLNDFPLNIDLAIDIFKNHLDYNIQEHHNLGVAYYKNDQLQEAQKHLTHAFTNNMMNSGFYLFLTAAKYKSHKYIAESIETLRPLMQRDFSTANDEENKEYLELARITFAELILFNDDKFRTEENLQLAVNNLQKATSTKARLVMAEYYLSAKQFNLAAQCFNQIIQTKQPDPNFETLKPNFEFIKLGAKIAYGSLLVRRKILINGDPLKYARSYFAAGNKSTDATAHINNLMFSIYDNTDHNMLRLKMDLVNAFAEEDINKEYTITIFDIAHFKGDYEVVINKVKQIINMILLSHTKYEKITKDSVYIKSTSQASIRLLDFLIDDLNEKKAIGTLSNDQFNQIIIEFKELKVKLNEYLQ